MYNVKVGLKKEQKHNIAANNFSSALVGQLGTPGRFSGICYKGCTFYDFLFAFLHKKSLLKKGLLLKERICSPWEQILFLLDPIGSKFFPFRVENGPNRKGETMLTGSKFYALRVAPSGANSFRFSVDPFSEGSKNNFDRVASPLSESFPLELSSK